MVENTMSLFIHVSFKLIFYLENLILIREKLIDRDTAILELEKDPYPKELLENDKKLFLNKLELTNEEFDIIMNLPVKKFEDYPSYEKSYLIKLLRKIYLIVKPIFKF